MAIEKQKIGTYKYNADSNKEEWIVRLDKDSYFACNRQVDAEILCSLIRTERTLQRYFKIYGGTVRGN